MLIPSSNSILRENLSFGILPSKQHRMILQGYRIIRQCDTLKAMEQTIFKILGTERYKYIIYSWNYGIELEDLFGQPVMYVCPELERRIKEALLQDDRINAVDNFKFDVTSKRGTVFTTFTVHTIFGDLDEKIEVNI